MANHVWTFDPRKVNVTLGGQEVFGWSEGSMFTISKADQVTTTTRGVDGRDMTININPMADGTFSMSLQHTSPFNKVMYKWAEAYKLGLAASYIMPFQMRDPSGAYVNTLCWLETVPDYSVAQETGELTWVIHLQDSTPKPSESYSQASGLAAVADLVGIKL
jgi:hypothetical protein